MKRLLIVSAVLASLLSTGSPLAAQERSRAQLGEDSVVAADEVTAKLREGAKIHALITIVLDQERYELAPAEFQKILDLGFEGEHEKLVVQSAWQIVERLRAARRYAIAHDILDRTLAHTREGASCFSLNMQKAKVYQEQRLFRQAIATVQAADRCQATPR